MDLRSLARTNARKVMDTPEGRMLIAYLIEQTGVEYSPLRATPEETHCEVIRQEIGRVMLGWASSDHQMYDRMKYEYEKIKESVDGRGCEY